MKKKYLLLASLFIALFFTSLDSFGQYSNYYSKVDANINVKSNININKNVNVSGNINKTVTTIDYGALRLANAQKEKNRLESLKYSDNKQKNQAIEIASNPIKAFDYGEDNSWVMDKKQARSYGFSKGTVYYHKKPNKSLFSSMGGYKYRNESEDGIVTEIEFDFAGYLFGMTNYLKLSKDKKRETKKFWQPFLGNTEKWVKNQVIQLEVGKVTKDGQYTHKIDINKAKVFREEGFVWSWFYEDDYEYAIKDNFRLLLANGFEVLVGVRYRGDKDKIDFEKLEGRRAYLDRLCKQIIATANIKLGKRGFND
tara:strand:+ start:1653 stop:2585 length:933 start_codon:yes stop_codon:yes gene_type:complete